MAELGFVWATRAGGDGRTARRYRDVVVDGIALSSLIGGDLVSPFGWGPVQFELAALDRLLQRGPPDCPEERTSLYVCPECGDLGCGAVSLVVKREGSGVVWREFGFQNSYEEDIHREPYSSIGPFVFDVANYDEVLEASIRDARQRGV